MKTDTAVMLWIAGTAIVAAIGGLVDAILLNLFVLTAFLLLR